MTKPFQQVRWLTAIAMTLVSGSPGAELVAQSPAASRARFEVASVKPSFSPAQIGAEIGRSIAAGQPPPAPPVIPVGIRTYRGGRFTANTSLRELIVWAYNVKDYQIEGGPKWAGDDYFVIDARAGREATPAEFNDMVKALLADRFRFRGRTATRAGKTYHLVLARADGKLGSALKPTSPECLAQIEEQKRTAAISPPSAPAQPTRTAASGPPDLTPRCGRTMASLGFTPSRPSTLSVSGQPLSKLVEYLVSELGATVVDRTGLKGPFDFFVDYQSQRLIIPGLGQRGLDPNGNDSPKLPLATAIERQLGLKLEAIEGQVPILVIDAAERPTPD